jgi:carboxypeptidase Q
MASGRERWRREGPYRLQESVGPGMGVHMKVRALPAVFVALGLALGACGKKKDTASPIPPPAPNRFTSPEADAEADEEEDEEEDVDAEGEDEEGGFGAPKSAAPKSAAPKSAEPTSAEPKAAPKSTAWMQGAAKKLAAHSKGKTRAWDRLAEMTDTFGHRLSGSKALENAIDWTIDTMKADGLANVRREKVMVPKWVRGKESLRVVAPFDRELRMLGLGMSVGTQGTLRGEVVVVDHVQDIAKQPKGALTGKVVLINQVMPPYDAKKHDSHYGETVVARSIGASEAAKMGASAVLIRSVTATSLDTPHTGSLSYADGVRKIPAAALTHEAADTLARAVKRGGGKVKVALQMGAKHMGDVPSANAIGELVGREKPEEVVVIGGHIDSWDVGTGASDDGAGCLIAMEAALLLKELELVPRRTIRVVLFTNEENGLRGGLAYFDAHGKEKHAGAIESDSGSGAPFGFSIKTDDKAAEKRVMSWRKAFAPLHADHFFTGWGGADISPLTKVGVLSMALAPDGSRYFDLHHSPADTVDKIDPAHIEGNAAAMALMAYILAEA